MAFTGDGASNNGLYHEVLNMAGLYNAPLVIIVENNQYAYSTHCQQASKVASIARHAAGYGLQTTTVDGNDVEAVHAAAQAAVERARSGAGASLIEAQTLRMLVTQSTTAPSTSRAICSRHGKRAIPWSAIGARSALPA